MSDLPIDVIPDRLLPMLDLTADEKQHLVWLNAVIRRACVRPTKQNLYQLGALVDGLPQGEMPSAAEVKKLTTPARPQSEIDAARKARREKADRRYEARVAAKRAAEEKEAEKEAALASSLEELAALSEEDVAAIAALSEEDVAALDELSEGELAALQPDPLAEDQEGGEEE